MKIKNGMKKKPDLIRYSKEMKNVLYERGWLKTAKNFPVYYVWRGLKDPRKRNRKASLRNRKDNLRYDITIILPKMLGREFPKTQGHNHSLNYPELITVLKGKAIFLSQKCQGKRVDDVYYVTAEKGETLIAPAEYAHFTINPTVEKLKFANWINKKNANVYDFVEKMRGACYYYTKSGWVKNKNYKKVPKLKFKKPLKSVPKNLDFLYGKKYN